MLLTQFQNVQNIDSRINDIHTELIRLYTERKQLYESLPHTPAPLSAVDATHATVDQRDQREAWALSQYEKLLTKWQRHNVAIPPLKKLQPQLDMAFEVTQRIAQARPELLGKMELVLVPPYKQLAAIAQAKQKPLFSYNGEAQDLGKAPRTQSKVWQALLVYNEPEGVYLGTPAALLTNKRYIFADFDMYALGLTEYQALVVQEQQVFDETTWTVLYKNAKANAEQLACAKRNNDGYKVDKETTNTAFGDMRFRPAISLKGNQK